jgi:hypothetical protein
MTWAWLNFHLVVEGLHVASVDAKDDVLDQLERIASSPFSPHGVDAHRICVEGKQDRWVAWLAHGYVLTYRPYVAGPPPLASRNISVLAFGHLSDYEAEPPE